MRRPTVVTFWKTASENYPEKNSPISNPLFPRHFPRATPLFALFSPKPPNPKKINKKPNLSIAPSCVRICPPEPLGSQS